MKLDRSLNLTVGNQLQGLTLPHYRCRKVVAALKIADCEVIPTPTRPRYIIYPYDQRYPAFDVTDIYWGKHQPRPGGYWVLYENGYESFSPADVFEDGYTYIVPDEPLGEENAKEGSKDVSRGESENPSYENQERFTTHAISPKGNVAPTRTNRIAGSGHSTVNDDS